MTSVAVALDDVAGVAQRLAVLLAAGIAPERAWHFLAEPAPAADESQPEASRQSAAVRVATPSPLDAATVVRAAASAAARAGDVAAAIRAQCAQAPAFGIAGQRAAAWGLFAAAWTVATRSGAPLAATLTSFAAGVRRASALHRELGVAFSGPKSTARLVGALPLVALGFGLLLGFDTLHVLVATPIGWACLVVGFGLMVAARRWSRRLIGAAEPHDFAPGLEAELVAVAMGSGASIARARELVTSALAAYAPSAAGAAGARAVDAVLDLAARAGVPTVGLLRAEAELRRADADAAGRAAVASVAVRLMVPLAVCALPSFMALGVVPVLVALFAGSGITVG